MKKNVIFFIFLILIITPLFSSYQESLGIVKQNDNINLIQTCYGASSGNVTRIIYPDKTFAVNSNKVMTKIGDNFNWTFSNTSQLGQYLVYGICDSQVWQYDFEVTPDGTKLTGYSISFYIFILIILATLIYLSFHYSLPDMEKPNEYELYTKSSGNKFVFFMKVLGNKLYIFGIFGIYIFALLFMVFFSKIVFLLNITEFYEISKVTLLLLSWGLIPFVLFWGGYLILVFYNATEKILHYQFGGIKR
jgi:hypothetical protein